ncbi:MAG: apolipoprotein N-acyltransferase [Planctomycetota bacterium]|jgi:apolipoprotein N-acyltransferase
MSKRRRKPGSPKAKLDVRALGETPPPEAFEGRLVPRRRLSVALLSVVAAVVLSVSFAPFDCWILAYVAMVPWLLALTGGTRGRWAILWGWLAGVIFWGANLYWLWWITLIGYFALVLYMSVYWLVAAAIVRAGVRRKIPLWIVFPVVWVALEYARAYLIGGFPWFFLAHSQYRQTRLIQIADLAGQYGVSFFVALANGAVADLLVSPLFARKRTGPRVTRKIVAGLAAAGVAAAGLLGYGSWRLAQQTSSEGPAIALVQCAFRSTLGGRERTEQEIFDGHLNLVKSLEGAECDLVVLPETMLPSGLNAEILTSDLNLLPPSHLRALAEKFVGPEAREVASDVSLRRFLAELIQAGFLELEPDSLDGRMLLVLGGNFAGRPFDEDQLDEALSELEKARERIRSDSGKRPRLPDRAGYAMKVAAASEGLGCPILAGGTTWHYNEKPVYLGDEWLSKNSALWFDQTWRAGKLYSKMQLVPFSEYLPLKSSWPWLYRRLRWFVPKVMSQAEPGGELVRFDLKRPAGTWQLVTPICYEGTFARVCRAMVRNRPKDKLIMANLSNDGWFVWRSQSGVNNPSNEQSQHLASYCFRAVENRVPIVRAVNTGISASITSNGRLAAVLEKDGRCEMVRGTLLLDGARRNDTEYLPGHGPKVLVDSRVSLYSLFGDVFAMLVSLAALAMTVYIVFSRLRAGKERK